MLCAGTERAEKLLLLRSSSLSVSSSSSLGWKMDGLHSTAAPIGDIVVTGRTPSKSTALVTSIAVHVDSDARTFS